MTQDFELLAMLCAVRATSGDEEPLKDYIISYIKENKSNWLVEPEIITGEDMQDCIILKFGEPKTAIFAHMDSIGFTASYGSSLVKIGGPKAESGYQLVGRDSQGEIECEINVDDEGQLYYLFEREIDRGTPLTFKPDFRETENYVQCCYMDDRLGVYNALKVAEDLENGLIVFSCWEEHGGASIGYLSRIIQEKFKVRQALISDITWVTEGVHHGAGVAISMRDGSLPRQKFIRKIIAHAKKTDIDFQLEVESGGYSDGSALSKTAYAWDWCFIGAPEDNVHSPDEIVHKHDIDEMVRLYKYLMKTL